jgi:hypothetical protein
MRGCPRSRQFSHYALAVFFSFVCNYNFAAHRRHGSGRGFGVRGGQDGTEDACEKGKEDYRYKKDDEKDEFKDEKDETKGNKEDERRRGSWRRTSRKMSKKKK